MKSPCQYEHSLGDLVLPGIAHCIGKDILLINASREVGWIFQVILSSSLKGKPARKDPSLLVERIVSHCNSH